MTWTRAGKAQGYDTEKAFDTHMAVARGTVANPVEIAEQVGDAPVAFGTAATVVESVYRCDYAYHAQMEPLNAVASVSSAGDAAEIWCGTQSQPVAVEATANALGIPKSKVVVARHADGRWLRPSRQPRPGVRGRCRPAVERGETAGQGHVDA